MNTSNDWQMALFRHIVSAWDTADQAIFEIKRCYEPDEAFIFENASNRFSVPAKLLTTDLIRDCFLIHNKRVNELEAQKRSVCQ